METKIVKILSETEVVIGAGSTTGVSEGMEFVIYEKGDEILDPETNKSLGALEIIKGYVTVINVQVNVSIAKTHTRTITRTRRIPYSLGIPSMMLGYRDEELEVEKVDKLRIEKTDPDYQKKLIVRVGDKARLTQS